MRTLENASFEQSIQTESLLSHICDVTRENTNSHYGS